MIFKFIVQVVSFLLMFLWGNYLGWKTGRKRRPPLDGLKTLSGEELYGLDEAIIHEFERRQKESLAERKAKTAEFKEEMRPSIEYSVKDEPFREFSEDEQCKH